MCFDSISYSSNIYTNSKYYSMLYSLHSQASFVFWQISCVVYALLVWPMRAALQTLPFCLFAIWIIYLTARLSVDDLCLSSE